jgi:hsp70-interacting protein
LTPQNHKKITKEASDWINTNHRMDRGLNELLKWSIENASTTENDPSAAPPENRGLNAEAMAALFGGPSEADLMKVSMEAITSADPEITLDDKLVAFDNFEQLIESLDNANNIANLGLWTPLLEQLQHDEAEIRKMAAWCIGTAVQNNERTQERLFAMGGIPPLVRLATQQGEQSDVRRKAIYALSSACRNYQPAMDLCSEELAKTGRSGEKVDAQDMDAVDAVIQPLRDEAMRA